MRGLRDRIQRELQIWRIGAVPGLLVILLVLLARWAGSLQAAEWFALDVLLRSRPPEPIDQRLLIVGIDEADLQQLRTYPVPDREVAALIEALQRRQPAVIGLDIFRDLPVEPGHADLVRVLQTSPDLIGIERVLAAEASGTIAPPPALPPAQVGFADAVLDADGALRRSLLALKTPTGEFKLSLTLRLAERYLAAQGVSIDNGRRDPVAVRFGSRELERFLPNSGGYVRADARGNQVLLNFRSGSRPFAIVSLRDVRAGRVPDDWMRGRIVLIGITATSVKDVVNTAAVSGDARFINGVEIQAHAVSQIVSAVLDDRPLLWVWADGWEALWIVAWGVLGISLGRLIRSPVQLLGGLAIVCLLLVGICYGLLLLGGWLPLVPAFLVLFLNGAGLTASMFYRHEQDLRSKLRDRQLIIDQTFDAIHNGPLQTLARLRRRVQDGEDAPLQADLAFLNQELRAVYESVRREALSQDGSFHLGNEQAIDLSTPLHEVLYEVYDHTLSRDFPCFQQLKLTVPDFQPIDDRFLSVEQKRGLCRFLEEALCNVGKYATGVTRLEVVCGRQGSQNIIRVTDNGAGLRPSQTGDRPTGRGTQQAQDLARQLGGQFRRSPHVPQGTVCELSWSAAKPWFWWF